MSEHARHDIDELFSAAIDEELTQRQQTELKRLLQHQPEMAEQLETLRRQRQLLSSLPVETAPPSLAGDIQARLERKLILDHTAQMQGTRSRAALLRRRFVAAAAMLFLPLGLLGIVVYHIITPTPEGLSQSPTASSLLKDEPPLVLPETAAPAVVAVYPFDAVLTLTTDQPMPAAQMIKKQIFLKAMENHTMPNLAQDRIEFQIACPAETLADFIGSLAGLWDQLSDSRLTLKDTEAPERPVVVPYIRPEQIQHLALQPDRMPMRSAALQYASANTPLEPAEIPMADSPEQLTIPQPSLAWPQQETPAQEGVLPHVRLLIKVQRPE